jgi:deferrochelatase/peroxidase EfeB
MTEAELNGRKTLLDETDPDIADLLTKLQGNILKGHGRDYGEYIFFELPENRTLARDQLKVLKNTYVTSARAQKLQALNKDVAQARFGNLFLTAAGYEHLQTGLSERFRHSPVAGLSTNFVDGMRTHAVEDLRDPHPDTWEEPYAQKQRKIHALLFLAHDDRSEVTRASNEVAIPSQQIIARESGNMWRNESLWPVEHFGFVDGTSQPLFFSGDYEMDATGKAVRERTSRYTTQRYEPFPLLPAALTVDPCAPGNQNCFGSYLVFRKLEQNVKAFWTAAQGLATDLGFADAERAAAMAIGRFKDGTPLVLSDVPGVARDRHNDFMYDSAVDEPNGFGSRCPLHAHIRKVNGRTIGHRARLPLRRSLSYGTRSTPPHLAQSIEEMPETGCGLLFQAFQGNITSQFGLMQKFWLNSVTFPLDGVGVDPLAGRPVNGWDAPQLWGRHYDQVPDPSRDPRRHFGDFVHMKGGEYFFAPSLPFFDSL